MLLFVHEGEHANCLNIPFLTFHLRGLITDFGYGQKSLTMVTSFYLQCLKTDFGFGQCIRISFSNDNSGI
jgi:hypothetical protein